jgi:hypothetical protein
MALSEGRLSKDGSSVRTDTAQSQNEEAPEPIESAYTPAERTAIDEANEAFAIVIKAVETLEDIEGWVPSLVKGVRALRWRCERRVPCITLTKNIGKPSAFF